MRGVNLSLLEKAKVLASLLRRPTKLVQLVLVGEYMSRVKALYKKYPESPEELPRWVDSVESLYREFKKRLGIDW